MTSSSLQGRVSEWLAMGWELRMEGGTLRGWGRETDLRVLQTSAGSRGITLPEVPMAGRFLGLWH